MSTTVRQSPRQSSRSQTRRDSNESVGRSRSRSLDRLDSDAATKLSMPTRSQAGRRREQNEPYPVSSVGVVTADAAGTPAMMPVITPQTRGVADPSTPLMPPPSPVRRVVQRPEPASPRDRRLEIREQHKDSIASTKTMDFTPLESCDPSMLRKCTDGKHIVSSPDVESDVPIVKAAGTREGECDNGVSEEERISADAYHRSQAKQEQSEYPVSSVGVVTADAAGTPAMMPVITPQTRGVADPSTPLMPPPSPVRRVVQRPEPASPRDRRLEIREQHKDSIASTKTMDFTPLESCDPSMLRKCTDGKHIVSSPDVESDVPIVKAAGTREGECDNGVSEEERISADAYHRSQAKQEHARESVAALTRGGLVLGPGFARGSCLLQRPQSRATSVSESRSNNACAQHDIGALLSNARAQLH